ncbi:ribose-5-phosphate isomerase RpiA [Mobilitalea sibirica]|uniref:Ribose-5-phosphate isomerase A n=1 Tax=Mobilitalea sibirica TaxID=1462919 RepID=A0A8J7H9B3_9FIRM|nr:ribose-5-phosphate isomerase RpiA [Mobilitalea sibirica]MBH1940955.1 ribose-5-phosphate isomerase RpiA [Mobilitalea sibirica]
MEQKRMAGVKATEYIKDGMILGLGTGSTAYYMIERVGEMVKKGLKIQAVATSESTTRLANQFMIPLVSIDEVKEIDLVIDGVDEIDPDFNAIKGGGGALFREKMVAKVAKEVIWIMDSSKTVDALGAFPLPVEILPYGYQHIMARLERLQYNPKLRRNNKEIYITDNHNYIADLWIEKPLKVKEVEEKLKNITGVLETGLFLNLCDRIIIGNDTGVKIIENTKK